MVMLPNWFLYSSLILNLSYFSLLDYIWSKYQFLVYLFRHTYTAATPQDARWLIYFLICTDGANFIYLINFKYSSIMTWYLRRCDIFAMLGGLFLVYLLLFVFHHLLVPHQPGYYAHIIWYLWEGAHIT